MPISYDNSPNSLLNTKNKRMIGIVSILGLVIFFDFLMFLFLSETIKTVFFPTQTSDLLLKIQITGLFIAGYLARPIGGYFLGRLSDKKGRKSALLIGLMMMSIFTMSIGLLPSYQSIGILSPLLFLIARIGQGVAFGGCVTNNWIFISEHTPKRHLFTVTSIITAAYLVGLLLALFVFGLYYDSLGLHSMLSYGWRLPFFLAGIFTILALYLLKSVDESPVYQHLSSSYASSSLSSKPLSKELSTTPNSKNDIQERAIQPQQQHLQQQHPQRPQAQRQAQQNPYSNIILCLLLTWIMSSIFTIFEFSLPSIIQTSYHIPTDYLNISSTLGLGFMVLGSVFFGFLADKTNEHMVLMLGLFMLMVQSFTLFMHLQTGGDFILILYALYGFNAGVASIIPAMMLTLFRANVRATNMGTCYNSMYAIIGGLLPLTLTYATTLLTLSTPFYMLILCITGIAIGVYLYRQPEFIPQSL